MKLKTILAVISANLSIWYRKLLKKILPKVNSIIHLAAAVGVGQSMYKIEQQKIS